MTVRVNHLHLFVMKYGWVLEIIIDLPIGFPINKIISLWVGEVNVHDFFESMSTSTVDIEKKMGRRSTLTVCANCTQLYK